MCFSKWLEFHLSIHQYNLKFIAIFFGNFSNTVVLVIVFLRLAGTVRNYEHGQRENVMKIA